MSVLRGASAYCSEPVCAEDAEGEGGDVCYSRGARAEPPSILDFFIRFLSSRMRFKRNGSYTLNR